MCDKSNNMCAPSAETLPAATPRCSPRPDRAAMRHPRRPRGEREERGDRPRQAARTRDQGVKERLNKVPVCGKLFFAVFFLFSRRELHARRHRDPGGAGLVPGPAGDDPDAQISLRHGNQQGEQSRKTYLVNKFWSSEQKHIRGKGYIFSTWIVGEKVVGTYVRKVFSSLCSNGRQQQNTTAYLRTRKRATVEKNSIEY